MEDAQIVALYWARDENAIAETERKYGRFCRALAENILSIHEDAEECVNDAYRLTWESIPPQKPAFLRAWLGRLTRSLAINRWNSADAQKGGGGAELLLGELEDCVPAADSVERTLENEALGAAISGWLRSLPADDRALFVRRYWYGEALNDLAEAWGVGAARLAQRMLRLRRRLKKTLEGEGFGV